jgi:hypothetical protein
MKKITIKDCFEAIKYKINDGAEYLWTCYGKNAYILDSLNSKGSVAFIFDKKDQTIYELSVCDYVKNTAYKWVNPSFIEKNRKEMKKRGFSEDQAWDSINYQPTDIEKIIKLTKAIANRK